jgi:hypothetical protein
MTLWGNSNDFMQATWGGQVYLLGSLLRWITFAGPEDLAKKRKFYMHLCRTPARWVRVTGLRFGRRFSQTISCRHDHTLDRKVGSSHGRGSGPYEPIFHQRGLKVRPFEMGIMASRVEHRVGAPDIVAAQFPPILVAIPQRLVNLSSMNRSSGRELRHTRNTRAPAATSIR